MDFEPRTLALRVPWLREVVYSCHTTSGEEEWLPTTRTSAADKTEADKWVVSMIFPETESRVVTVILYAFPCGTRYTIKILDSDVAIKCGVPLMLRLVNTEAGHFEDVVSQASP
jgi:hypothetical protein